MKKLLIGMLVVSSLVATGCVTSYTHTVTPESDIYSLQYEE